MESNQEQTSQIYQKPNEEIEIDPEKFYGMPIDKLKYIPLRKLLPEGFIKNLDPHFRFFCKLIRENLRQENYEILGTTGFPGTGKSQCESIIGCLIDPRFSFGKNVNFIPVASEIEKDYLDLPMYSFFQIDEASRSVHKHKWYEKTQQKLSTLYDSVSKDTEIFFYDNNEFKIMTIEEMFKTYGEDPINLKTFTINDNFKVLLKPINKILQRPIREQKKRMFRIKTRFNKEIIVTEDHSIFTFRNRGEKIIKIKPTELKLKDKIIIPKILPSINTINEDNDKMQLYGAWLADGCYQKNKGIYTSIKISGLDHKKLFDKIAKKFPNKSNKSEVKCYNGIDLIFTNKELIDEMLIKKLYGNSYNKRVPSWVFNTTDENKKYFLKGFFTGDGFINKEGRANVCSVNKWLLRDIQLLLNMLGIVSSWYKEDSKESYFFGKTYTTRETYHLNIPTCFNKQYIEFFEDTKRNYQILKNYKFTKGNMISKRHEKYIKNDCVCVAITKIEEIFDYEGNVYDLSIDNIHRFIGNDILVSNTERENHYICTGLIMPRFNNFTENFRNFFIKYWINIITRGVCIVYRRDEDKDTKDPWNIDASVKLKNKYWGGKRVFERSVSDVIRMEQKTKNYWFYFTIPEIPKEVWSIYKVLKRQSRVKMREEANNLQVESYKDKLQKNKQDRWTKIITYYNEGKDANEIGALMDLTGVIIRQNLRDIKAHQKVKGEVWGLKLLDKDIDNNIYNLKYKDQLNVKAEDVYNI